MKRFNVNSVKKNVRVILMMTVMIVMVSVLTAVSASDAGQTPANTDAAAANVSGLSMGSGVGLLAAALVTSVSCIGGGIAVSASASAAIGAISENPKIFGQALIFVALAEGIALYGLIISIQILSKIVV